MGEGVVQKKSVDPSQRFFACWVAVAVVHADLRAIDQAGESPSSVLASSALWDGARGVPPCGLLGTP